MGYSLNSLRTGVLSVNVSRVVQSSELTTVHVHGNMISFEWARSLCLVHSHITLPTVCGLLHWTDVQARDAVVC